jgi:hypothetical protein
MTQNNNNNNNHHHHHHHISRSPASRRITVEAAQRNDVLQRLCNHLLDLKKHIKVAQALMWMWNLQARGRRDNHQINAEPVLQNVQMAALDGRELHGQHNSRTVPTYGVKLGPVHTHTADLVQSTSTGLCAHNCPSETGWPPTAGSSIAVPRISMASPLLRSCLSRSFVYHMLAKDSKRALCGQCTATSFPPFFRLLLATRKRMSLGMLS